MKLRSKAFQGTSHQQNHLSCVFAPVKSELLSVFWATHQNCLRLLRPRLKISSSTGKNVALWILDMAQCSKRRPWVKQFSGATPDSKMLLLGPQGVSNIFSQRLTENWMRCWDDEYHWISAKIRWPNFHIYFVHVVHLHLPAVPGDYHCADSAADLPGFEHSKGPPRSMQKGSRSPQRSGTHQAQNGLSFHQFSPVQFVWIFWMGKIIKSVECHVFKRTLIRSLSEAMTPRQFKIMRKSDRATPSSSRYPCTSPRAFLTTTGSYSTKKRNPSSCRPFHEVVFEVEQHLSNGTTFTIGKAKNMPFHKRIKNAKELNIWSIPPSESSLIPPLQPSPHAELPRNA